MRFQDPFADRLVGSLIGLMTGDALGMPVEGWPWPRIAARFGWLKEMIDGRFPAGTYTDDGQMALGLVESMVEAGGFDAQRCAARWLANFEPARGYGGRIHDLMDRLAAGEAWDGVATDSWGNGAAMRVGPLGAYYSAYARTRPQRVVTPALDQARITHAHPEAGAGAAIVALAVGRALSLGLDGRTIDRPEFIAWLKETAEELHPPLAERLAVLAGIAPGPREEVRERLAAAFGCDVRTKEAVPPAIGAFLLSDSLEDTVCLAVNLGGDTDTLAAMAGSMAGAYWGASAIPEPWWDVLENGPGSGRDYAVGLGLSLARTAVRPSESV